MKTTPLADRFWPKVEKTAACWLWKASVDRDGYGMIGLGGKHGGKGKAHRVSYELANGPIPAGAVLMHSCDNRACVNPAHLTVGTHRDNVLDMAAKGRTHNQQKTHCKHGHELTPENIYIGRNNARRCKACIAREGAAAYRKQHPEKPYTPTGKTCSQCAEKEPKVRFRPGHSACSACQYQATKAKRGVWNKKHQLTKI